MYKLKYFLFGFVSAFIFFALWQILSSAYGQNNHGSESYKTEPLDHNDYFQLGSYKLIKDDLFTDSVGSLYFLTYEFANKQDQADVDTYQMIFLKQFDKYNVDTKDTPSPLIGSVIDAKSWRKVADTFYRDEHNLYCRRDFSSGAVLLHLEAFNPDDMKFIIQNGKMQETISFDKVEQGRSKKFVSFYATDGEKIVDARCREVDEITLDE
ncbi:hypothetical protein [Fretibacter rubidus]|uniref:hypothetical protein n=1 Tax=Fretibacter rubidus TaxID=570162 RepID=UPI00352B3A54